MSSTDGSGGLRGVEEILAKVGDIIVFAILITLLILYTILPIPVHLKYYGLPLGVLNISLLIIFLITTLIVCITKALRKPIFKPMLKYLQIPSVILLVITCVITLISKGMSPQRIVIYTTGIIILIVYLMYLFFKVPD